MLNVVLFSSPFPIAARLLHSFANFKVLEPDQNSWSMEREQIVNGYKH